MTELKLYILKQRANLTTVSPRDTYIIIKGTIKLPEDFRIVIYKN